MNNDKKKQKSELFCAISLASQLGFFIVLPLIGFLLLGLFLDRKFNTLPIFLISFIILSIVLIPFELKYLLLPFLEKKVGKNKKNNQNKI